MPWNKESDLVPGLRKTPGTGRHAILPGVGLPKADTIVPLHVNPHGGPALPDLDVPGRLPEDNPRLIRRDHNMTDDPEAMLNAMIGECHFLMREVAFRCIVQTSDARERIDFLNSAMDLAKTGAEVAKTVVAFRHAPPSDDRLERMLADAERLAGKNNKS